MSRSDEFIALLAWEAQTPRERLLARVLDAALRADRTVPGSATQVLDELPDRAQVDLRGLVELARTLSASTQAVGPSAAFRQTGRQRLLAAITATPAESTSEPPSRSAAGLPAASLVAARRSAARVWLATRSRGAGHWLARAAASLAIVASAGLVTVNASASTLPGEPLYTVKQARETLAIQFAPSDEARALALLQQADARLDETTRLVRQGRTAEAAQAASRCVEALSAANATLQEVGGPTAEHHAQVELVADQLAKQQEQLAAFLDEGSRSERTEFEAAPDESLRDDSRADEPAVPAVMEAPPAATAAVSRDEVQPRVPPAQAATLPSTRQEPTTAPSPVEAVEGDNSGGRPPASHRGDPQPRSGRPGQVPAVPLPPPAAVEDQHDADGGGDEHGPAEIRSGGRGGDADLSATSGRSQHQAQPVTTAPIPAQGADGDRSSPDEGGGRGAPAAAPPASHTAVPDGTGATRNGVRRALPPPVVAGPTTTTAPTPTPRPAGRAQNGGGGSQSGQPGQTVQADRGSGQSGGRNGSQNGGGGGGSRGGDGQRADDQHRTSDHR